VSNDKNAIHLWDLSTGQRLQTYVYRTSRMSWISMSPDGENIALLAHDFRVVLKWNLSSGERSQTHSACTIKSIHYPPYGEKIVLINYDNQILIWDPSNGDGLQQLNAHKSRIQAITFSPDGDKFASLSVDAMLQICDMSTGHCIQTLQTSKSNRDGYGITFHPDGLYVASSCGEIAQLWHISTGQCLQTLRGHITAISMMAFSCDGRLFASASGNPKYDWISSRSDSDYNSLRLWNLFTGQCIYILDGTPAITSLSFSSDGQYLNTSLGDVTLSPVTNSTE
jgi:WD40 repeat protein